MSTTNPGPARVSASIVLYNSPAHLLQATLDSLALAAREAAAAGLLASLEVRVVDNSPVAAKRAVTRERLARWRGGDACSLEYTESADNRGFGAGNNAALAGVDSELCLVLNPDVELAPDSLLRGLAVMAREPGVVLLSPRVTDADGQQEFLCKRYPSVAVLLLRGFTPRFLRAPFKTLLDDYEMRDACAGQEPAEVPLASGCCMLIRGDALRAVGGFDEDYFLYFEDFDLSLRLATLGRLQFEPAMGIVHHGGYAASKGLHHIGLFLRSALRFFNRHGWRWI